MARKEGVVASAVAIAGVWSWLIDDPDRTIADTALALFLTENRWAEPDQEFVLVRADVPAEIYSDLIWTVAAILGSALARTGVAPPRKVDTLDRKSTRLNSVTNAHLVCRLLLEKNKEHNHNTRGQHRIVATLNTGYTQQSKSSSRT